MPRASALFVRFGKKNVSQNLVLESKTEVSVTKHNTRAFLPLYFLVKLQLKYSFISSKGRNAC